MTQLRTVAITAGTGRVPAQLFQSLVLTAPGREAGRKSATFVISIGLHSTLALALAILPLLLGNALPSSGTLETFFATPLEITVAPPPPPPPWAADSTASGPCARSRRRRADSSRRSRSRRRSIPRTTSVPRSESRAASRAAYRVASSAASCSVPDRPTAPPPPARVVRIGGQIAQPKLLRRVEPRYPDLAVASRVSALVILEAEVDTRGYVRTVKVLRGHPLFDQPSLDAVKQWRYQPLLLNGEPTGFILTVTLTFSLQNR